MRGVKSGASCLNVLARSASSHGRPTAKQSRMASVWSPFETTQASPMRRTGL